MGFSAPNGQFAVFNKHPNFHFAAPPLHEHRQTLLYIHRPIHLALLTIAEDVGDRANSDDILYMTFQEIDRVIKYTMEIGSFSIGNTLFPLHPVFTFPPDNLFTVRGKSIGAEGFIILFKIPILCHFGINHRQAQVIKTTMTAIRTTYMNDNDNDNNNDNNDLTYPNEGVHAS